MKRSTSIFVRLLLGLTVGGGVLLLVEGGLRLGGIEPPYQSDLESWRMGPNRHEENLTTKEGGRFTYSTNEDGLRSSAAREKTEGVRRVVLMGDSMIFGWGVDDGSTLADGLKRELDDQYGYLGEVEVIDAGQPGYSTAQIAWLFDKAIRYYLPDLVVVFVPGHDIRVALVSDWEALHGARGWTASMRVFLARKSRIYQVLRLFVYPRAADEAQHPGLPDTERARVPRTSDTERALALDGMRKELATWGGELAVGMVPWEHDLRGRTRTDRPDSSAIIEYAESSGVPLFDMRYCCTGKSDWLLPNDTGHYSAAGNLGIGARMAPPVVEELFLRPLSSGQRAQPGPAQP